MIECCPEANQAHANSVSIIPLLQLHTFKMVGTLILLELALP